MNKSTQLIHLQRFIVGDSFTAEFERQRQLIALIEQLGHSQVLLHVDFIADELELKKQLSSSCSFEFEPLTLINPYKLMIFNLDYELAKQPLILSAGEQPGTLVNDQGTIIVETIGNQTKYYNFAGEQVVEVEKVNDETFISCTINTNYYVFSSAFQFMFTVLRCLIEQQHNWLIINSIEGYLPQFNSWQYTNMRHLFVLSSSPFKAQSSDFKNHWLKSLFTASPEVLIYSPNYQVAKLHKRISYLPLNELDEHSKQISSNLWNQLLSFEQPTSIATTSQPKFSLFKRSKSKPEDSHYFIDQINLEQFDPSSEQITITSFSPEILFEARTDSKIRAIIKKLEFNDYILSHNCNLSSTFIKRQFYLEQLANNLESGQFVENQIHWTEEQFGNPRKMLVIFSSLPPMTKYYSANMLERCFNPNNPRISEHIPNDVVVVRIADINGIYGSYYTNTTNFPDYEQRIGEVLQSIQKKYHLDNTDITLYGGSKGGYGALIHGLSHGYRVLALDPITTMKVYNHSCDLHYMQDIEVIDRFTHLQQLVTSTNSDYVYILVSSTGNYQTKENAYIALKLHNLNNKIKVIDLRLDTIKSHPEVTSKSLSIQNALFNKVLLT